MFTSNYETESHKIVQIILTITARKDTVNPVMNRLTTEKRVQVLSALVEGNSINSIVRMTGTAKHTVLKLLEDMGCACARDGSGACRSHLVPGAACSIAGH